MKTASGNRGDGAGREDLRRDSNVQDEDEHGFFTRNARHLRVLHALLRRAMPREHVDSVAGASNGPELVAELRRRGLEVPCVRVPCIDRDGFEVKRGVYNLTQHDRRAIRKFFAGLRNGTS